MKKLSKKQKNIIIDYIKNDFFNTDLFIEKNNNEFILLKQLEKANDYETLYQDYNRLKDDLLFLSDKSKKIQYVKDFN